MKRIVKILGCGTSTGVPVPTCQCHVCLSDNSKNKRLRSSVYVSIPELNRDYLIDTTPDLRTQALTANIQKIDFVVLTHDHADHLHGIDDLRPFCFKQNAEITIYTTQYFKKSLEKKFEYIFSDNKKPVLGGGIPRLTIEEVNLNQEMLINGLHFEFFSLPHGHGFSTGIYNDGMAYMVDCHDIPLEICDFLNSKNLEVLFIDCLRFAPHATHLHFDKTLEVIEKIAPKKAYLIHMSHDIDYKEIAAKLQNKGLTHVFPAYDGLSVSYDFL